jgi:hypothetical protein
MTNSDSWKEELREEESEDKEERDIGRWESNYCLLALSLGINVCIRLQRQERGEEKNG